MNTFRNEIVLFILCLHLSYAVADDFVDETPEPGTHDNPIVEPYYLEDQIPSSSKSVDFLLKACPDLSNQNVDSTCIAVLNETFRNDPIWASARYWYHDRSMVTSMGLLLGRSLLAYSHPDFVGSIPLWKDILDIDFDLHYAIAVQIFNDFKCQELASSKEGIQSELQDYCRADELYRYLAYIDYCISSHIRHLNRSNLTQLIEEPSPPVTGYEKSLESISDRYLSREMYQQQYAMQLRNNLKVAWLSNICIDAKEIVARITGVEIVQIDPFEFDISEPAELLEDHYSKLMLIAAKSGQPWAIRSYAPTYESGAYWKDLYEIRPLLVHRLLASSVGRSVLGEEHHAQHAVNTGFMLGQMFPTVDFFPNVYGGSPEALRYVENNGILTFPWDLPDRFP